MGILRKENHGPTESTNSTSEIVAGTTSGWEEFEVLGPIQIVTDTVFTPATCVMATGGGNKPIAGVTYPAGTWVFKYFTTLHLASGTVEVVAHKNADEISFQ